MKVAVSYDERTYGNSTRSTASEVTISGKELHVDMKIQFKEPQAGRSWDWMSTASVGGAAIEMSLADAKALAEALLAFAVVRESAQESNIVDVTLRLREGVLPERILRHRTLEQLRRELGERLQALKKK